MDKQIGQIVTKVVDGGQITPEELRRLFSVPYLSEESFMIQYASRRISETVSQGKVEIHAQVGINAGPCPKNCQFCSFASKNEIFSEAKVHTTEDIIEKCLLFEADGANAVYLMATATFKLADFLKLAKEVKAALKPETPLIANVGDFDIDGAKALRDAGFVGIYHALRLGEGSVTAIDPSLRLKTIDAANKAGLLIGTCLEPVGPEHTLDELVEKTILTREMKAVYSGAARRINLTASPLAAHGSMSYGKMAHILAAVRLATGYGMIGNCTHEPNGMGAMAGANLFWAELGSNPRDTKEQTVRGWTVQRTQIEVEEAGWQVLKGPSAMYSRK